MLQIRTMILLVDWFNSKKYWNTKREIEIRIKKQASTSFFFNRGVLIRLNLSLPSIIPAMVAKMAANGRIRIMALSIPMNTD